MAAMVAETIFHPVGVCVVRMQTSDPRERKGFLETFRYAHAHTHTRTRTHTHTHTQRVHA